MITVTIENLLAYYGLGLIAWMFICEAIPFNWHVRAFCLALAYNALPFFICSFA